MLLYGNGIELGDNSRSTYQVANMPAPPAIRYSPGREPRAENHKRGRSLESGIVLRGRDDDLALFNEVQTRERDDFLLQSNDDFEDTFVSKLRHFSDHKLGMNIAARGENSDILNTEEEKNDYEWLITPPDTPLFPSLDDEAPQVILTQRGRPRTQPVSISRSSTMERSHRSRRGSQSPNRLSSSPQSGNTTFPPRGRASPAPSSSPPATRRSTTASRRLSPPSSKLLTPASRVSTPPSRVSTPPPRRLSTGSTSTTSTGARGISPVKTSRGNSASPKVRAWQANIPGFSTEAPPNLRTSLADRPASYVRGSSPASRNGRQSKSPASRSISSSHSHDRDRSSPRSKGSIASSAEDDVESLPSITVEGSVRSNLRKVGGSRNNNALSSQKPSRTVSSSSAPKRSFDVALRQMDHRKGPQNMFRPLLSSVPSSTLYAGKASPAWNSSVTTSSNTSSDLGTNHAHDIEENEMIQDDATSGYVKVPDCNVSDEVFMFEKTDSLNEDTGHESHDTSPTVQLGNSNGDLILHSQQDGVEKLAEHDGGPCLVSDDFTGDGFPEVDSLKDMLLCSRCGCRFSVIRPTEEGIILCADCRKSYLPLTISHTVTGGVAMGVSQFEPTISDEDRELFKTANPKVENPEVTSMIEAQAEQYEDLPEDGDSTHAEAIGKVLSPSSHSQPQSQEREPTQVSHFVTSQPSVTYSDAGGEQIQHIDIANTKHDSVESVSIVMKRSSSIKGPVIRSANFSASSISYDDLSYLRASTNSMRSSVGRGSVSASSSADFGPAMHTDTRFQRQLSSRKSDVENTKHRRSISSLSGTSSHAFHPSSVGTSTLDSLEASIVHEGRDVAGAASVAPQEIPGENDTCTEDGDVNNVQVEITSTSELPTHGQTAIDSGEVLLPESSNFEEPALFQKVEELAKDTSALTACIPEEDTSLNPCVESTDAAEVQLGAISELGDTCLSSPASECNVSPRSESNVEEFQDPPVLTALDKDVAASATGQDVSDHSNSIIEESMVLVEGQGGIKGRSLTLEEATETILFCSSIVHNLAYEAASIAIEKEPLPDPTENNTSWPLVPTVGKDRKDVQSRKTSKRLSKSQKGRPRKATERESMKAANNTNTGEETDLPKPRIVFANNKENTKPPKLESKCNCRIM